MLTDEQMAERYFDNLIAPGLVRDRMPADGIDHLRQRYLTDALANEEARKELHRYFYPVRSQNDEETP